jgi:hypothetical protein
MVLTHEQRIFVVKHYFHNKSYALCQEAFQEAFLNDTVPNKTTIYCIIMKFEVFWVQQNSEHFEKNHTTLSTIILCINLVFLTFWDLLLEQTHKKT